MDEQLVRYRDWYAEWYAQWGCLDIGEFLKKRFPDIERESPADFQPPCEWLTRYPEGWREERHLPYESVSGIRAAYQPPRNGVYWCGIEEQAMMDMWLAGACLQRIAYHHGRKPSGISARIFVMCERMDGIFAGLIDMFYLPPERF